MSEKKTGLELLREPFPAHQISKLPKPTKKQTEEVKANYRAGTRCFICGTWHHPDVVHLDYVGHAALTDRLLDADTNWNWAPPSKEELECLPPAGKDGMWIKLTVCGVSRFGYGDAQGKAGGDAIKEIIGDALRNAAMRFGAALDLWHKGDLHLDEGDTETPPTQEQPKPQAPAKAKESGPEPDAVILAQFNAAKDVPALTKVFNGIPTGDRKLYNSIFQARMGELKKAA